MATNTSGKIILSKPAYTDTADINVINTNMDKIDYYVSSLITYHTIAASSTTAITLRSPSATSTDKTSPAQGTVIVISQAGTSTNPITVLHKTSATTLRGERNFSHLTVACASNVITITPDGSNAATYVTVINVPN